MKLKNKINSAKSKLNLFILIIFFFIMVTLKPTVIRGESMYPTLKNLDCLIINKLDDKLSQGDIIVFRLNSNTANNSNKNLIKRIIGLPGDHVVINQEEVVVNNIKIQEPYIHNSKTEGNIDIIIPNNCVFVMGDNRINSEDSRSLGPVPIDCIIGKVFFRLYPLKNLGSIE